MAESEVVSNLSFRPAGGAGGALVRIQVRNSSPLSGCYASLLKDLRLCSLQVISGAVGVGGGRLRGVNSVKALAERIGYRGCQGSTT